MNRAEWKAMHRTLRKDARDFAAQHGGYPTLATRLQHGGTEWTLTRTKLDTKRWHTRLAASRITRRPRMALVFAELNDIPSLRRLIKVRASHGPMEQHRLKRALRRTIEVAREIRTAA